MTDSKVTIIGPGALTASRLGLGLEHFPQKWIPVLRKKMRQTRNLERPI